MEPESASGRNGKPRVELPVLLYHRVGPLTHRGDASLTTLPERFEKQVLWLARHGYDGIRPADWLAWRRGQKTLPPKPVLLTFDDGYADVATHALPILERNGFGAAVFIVTSQIGGTNLWDRATGRGAHKLMTDREIRAWSGRGIEFGAHSRTHGSLADLTAAELESEVVGSKQDLEAVLESPVCSFAYPYGYHSRAAIECVQRTFDMAFSIEEGLNTAGTEPCLMRRTQVIPDETRFDLVCRLHWGWSPLHHLRHKVGLRTRARALLSLIFARGS